MENNLSLSVDINQGHGNHSHSPWAYSFQLSFVPFGSLRCKGKRILTNILLCYLDLESFMSSMNCP